MHAAAIFQAQSTAFYLENVQLNCTTVQNNAQNALKVAILRYKIKKFPLGAFGASFLAPTALDLGAFGASIAGIFFSLF